MSEVKTAQTEGGQKSILLSIAKGRYAKKTAKLQKQMEKQQEKILDLRADRQLLESKIEELGSRIALEQAGVTALCNSNNFLESVRGQSFRIDSVLIFLTLHNNRKMIERERKIELIKAQIEGIRAEIAQIDKKIELMSQGAESLSAAMGQLGAKQEDIETIEKLNIANPAISLFLAKNSKEAVADIEKYCYREVGEEELGRLDGFDYSRRRSGVHGGRVIIRFEKSFKEQFDVALGHPAQ